MRAWQVELFYETGAGKKKRMLSHPLTYTHAREHLLYYHRRGVRGRLVEIEEVTAGQLAALNWRDNLPDTEEREATGS